MQGLLLQLWAPLVSVGGLYRRLRKSLVDLEVRSSSLLNPIRLLSHCELRLCKCSHRGEMLWSWGMLSIEHTTKTTHIGFHTDALAHDSNIDAAACSDDH